jgi:hypothetical protein
MKKTRKQSNKKRPTRQLSSLKQRKNLQRKKNESPARAQWLQILSEEIEEDQARDAGNHSLLARNGRRSAPEMNLHVVERNLRSIRRFQ